MATRFAPTGAALVVAVAALTLLSQLADAQQSRTITKMVSLSSLAAAGFEIKAVTGNQSGVVGTLVLQKGQDVYLCEAKDLSIQPNAFECWPVK
ncbi:MAG: hypothetical protein WB772_07730 [Xanthobacteraceae bacterium]|jgi:hypothetical protein